MRIIDRPADAATRPCPDVRSGDVRRDVAGALTTSYDGFLRAKRRAISVGLLRPDLRFTEAEQAVTDEQQKPRRWHVARRPCRAEPLELELDERRDGCGADSSLQSE